MLNSCNFIGRLGKDPEIRHTQNDKVVANASIACESGWGDKKNTEWVRLVFFGRLAEIVQQYLAKGSLVYVNGRMQTREWEKDGVKRYSTEVIVNEMKMLGDKGERKEPQQAEAQHDDFGDSAIPF